MQTITMENIDKVDFGLAVEYLSGSPYIDAKTIYIMEAEYGAEVVMGLAGLLYTAEKTDAFNFHEIKRLILNSTDLTQSQAQALKYYAKVFPCRDMTFTTIYFDDIILKDIPSRANPHIILSHCFYRVVPMEIAIEVAEKTIANGLHHTYLIPDLCQRGVVVDMNALPFNEGNLYYTIEDGQIIESVWDEESELQYDPAKMYFKDSKDAEQWLRENL